MMTTFPSSRPLVEVACEATGRIFAIDAIADPPAADQRFFLDAEVWERHAAIERQRSQRLVHIAAIWANPESLPRPGNPRVAQLSCELRERGPSLPLTVTRTAQQLPATYWLARGHTVFAAYRVAGVTHVPVVVIAEAGDLAARIVAARMTPAEERDHYQLALDMREYLEDRGCTIREAMRRLGFYWTAAAAYATILDRLIPMGLDMLRTGRLSMTKATEIMWQSPAIQELLLSEIQAHTKRTARTRVARLRRSESSHDLEAPRPALRRVQRVLQAACRAPASPWRDGVIAALRFVLGIDVAVEKVFVHGYGRHYKIARDACGDDRESTQDPQ